MPLTVAVGDCLFTSMDIDHTHRVAPGYYATMGFGVPAGLGLQAASGTRALILVGDGAFQMTGWELGNCLRYGWDPIVIVFNNAGWGMLQCFQPDRPSIILANGIFTVWLKARGAMLCAAERAPNLALPWPKQS